MPLGTNCLRALYAEKTRLNGSKVLTSAAQTVYEVTCRAGLFTDGANPLATATVTALLRGHIEGRSYPTGSPPSDEAYAT